MHTPAQPSLPADDYKATLNIAQTDFPIRPNGAQDDTEMVLRWREERLWDAVMRLHAGREKFILHDGPPYANGDIHIGHAYNKILKDIVTKSRRMAGMHVPVVPGWDCHGLPIEHKVMTDCTDGDQTIDGNDRIAVKRACRSYAQHWIGRQKEAFQRLGVMMDWDHPYITMDPSYEAASVRVLKQLVEQGFIARKFKTVAWCFTCKTTLASAEIEYQERKDPSLYVAFPLVESEHVSAELKGASFLVWTTTPWTLPLNRAVALHPTAEYLVATCKGRRLIFGAERASAISQLLESELILHASIPASCFAGMRVHHPFIANLTVPIVFGDHVGLNEGTAAVHTAPGCGPEDYELGVKQGLEIYAPLTAEGTYSADIVPRELCGMAVVHAHGTIIQMVQAAENLIHKASLRHSYPHCWRCHNGLIYRATQQWFFELTHGQVQEQAVAASESIRFSPEQGASFLRAAVEHRWEWCLSRQRTWGIPIPALICESCDQALLDLELIEAVAHGIEAEGIEYWDRVSVSTFAAAQRPCQCGITAWRKERDILDVWFDSGVSHAIVLRSTRDQQYPADMYLEGIDQYRGWFQSSLLTALGLTGMPPMRMIMSHGFTVDEKGRKMSKSLGNVVQPQQLVDRLGTDGVRLWAASIDHGFDVVVSDSLLKNVEQVYLKIRNSCRFMLQNVGTFTIQDGLDFERLCYLDRMALVAWVRMHHVMLRAYAEFNTTAVFHGMGDACTIFLSAIYFDVIKDRLYTEIATGRERCSAQTVLWKILDSTTRLMAPILSFTMERVADHYRHPWIGSVHLQQFAADDFFGVVTEHVSDTSAYVRNWNLVLRVRDGVMRTMERERERGVMKHSRQAAVTLWYDSSRGVGAELARLIADITIAGEHAQDVLAELYVVATVTLSQEHSAQAGAEVLEGLWMCVAPAAGERCQRCWRWRTLDMQMKLCERCAYVVQQVR